jgi:Na+-transporting methylmalonyl-CoA/oxaloacetate decarboxylase gamma subunit
MNTFKLYLLGIAFLLAFFALLSYVYAMYRSSKLEDVVIDTTKKGPVALQVYKDGKLVGEYKSIAAALRDKTLDIPSASIRSSSYMLAIYV